eukprot:2231748-Amphidinium_carterae.1
MKRPFDHPRDMPTHVVYNHEVRDLPTLPRNLNWCYPELNMYAQVGQFPLCFQKELYMTISARALQECVISLVTLPDWRNSLKPLTRLMAFRTTD